VRRARVAAALALALGLPAAVAAQPRSRIEAGRAALEAGNTARARAAFSAAVEQGDPAEAALGEYHLALMADEALDFRAALAGYRRFVARDPGSRYASRALARIDDLHGHAEGGFAPLVALERVRRSTALSDDPRALEALDRASQAWPAGSVRAEAWMLVAEAFAGRMQRPRAAADVFLRLAEDDDAPPRLRELAATRLVELRAVLGEPARAEQELSDVHVPDAVRAEAAVFSRRVRLRRASTTVLALVALAGAAALALAWRRGQLPEVLRRWRRPMPLVQLAVLTAGGAAMAKAADDHEVSPFAVLGVGALGVYLVAVVFNVVGGAAGGARAARAAVCAMAVLAVAYLAMLKLDPMMLEGIGL
jgi:tetratricopeptide (TPR) repeat protein